MQQPSLAAFHAATKNTFIPVTFLPSEHWPTEWKTTYYKEYARFESISFPDPEYSSKFISLTAARKSTRDFSTTGVTLTQLGVLLKSIGGEFTHADGSVHRAQASGGARFAIEMYPVVRFSADDTLPSGVYHYNVKRHSLEYLWPITANNVQSEKIVRDKWAEQASVHIMFTAVFKRSANKYGARAYRYVCMEAGAMLQNAYLHATDVGLQLVGYGGTNDDVVEQLLRLDGEQESLISSCLVSV